MKTCDRVIQRPGSVVLARSRKYARTSLDALHVRDRLLELVHRRARRMDVGIDQPRQHRPAAEIDLLRVRRRPASAMSAFVPVATMRRPRIAMASTVRNCGSTVTILPVWKMWLGGGSRW